MADTNRYGTPEYQQAVKDYETKQQKLAETMEKWEAAAEELEALENQ